MNRREIIATTAWGGVSAEEGLSDADEMARKLQDPLGMGISKTLVLKSGMGIGAGIGYYYNLEKPTGAPDWTLKWSVAIVFP